MTYLIAAMCSSLPEVNAGREMATDLLKQKKNRLAENFNSIKKFILALLTCFVSR